MSAVATSPGRTSAGEVCARIQPQQFSRGRSSGDGCILDPVFACERDSSFGFTKITIRKNPENWTLTSAEHPEFPVEAGIALPDGKGLAVVITDLDGDRRLDIHVANETSPNLLFRFLGGMQFDEAAVLRGVTISGDGQVEAGIGVGLVLLIDDQPRVAHVPTGGSFQASHDPRVSGRTIRATNVAMFFLVRKFCGDFQILNPDS